MAKAQTILLAGGGTGGHLYPGVSVAEALRELNPAIKPVFLCTTRDIDRTILGSTGFDFIPQPIVPPVKTVAGLIRFWKSWRETLELVQQLLSSDQPFAVLGLGGYAAGVAVKLAARKKIPAAILNQDVIPGKANRYLLKYVKQVFCQFEETRSQVPSAHWSKLLITGCPIRRDIRSMPTRESAAARLSLDLKMNTLVVTGASQGAQTVNEAVLATLSTLRHQGWQVLHLAGKEHASTVQARYAEYAIPARVVDFTPAMADVFCGRRPGDRPIRRQHLCGTDGVRAAFDPDALSLPQGHASTGQRQGAGRMRGRRSSSTTKRMRRRTRTKCGRRLSCSCLMMPNAARWRMHHDDSANRMPRIKWLHLWRSTCQ